MQFSTFNLLRPLLPSIDQTTHPHINTKGPAGTSYHHKKRLKCGREWPGQLRVSHAISSYLLDP